MGPSVASLQRIQSFTALVFLPRKLALGLLTIILVLADLIDNFYAIGTDMSRELFLNNYIHEIGNTLIDFDLKMGSY